jgi:hypothetical protein
MRPAAFFFLAFTLAILVVISGAAQRVSSDILGTVKDPSGALVVGAQVTATNLETGVVRSTVTDDSGGYHVAGLSAGAYEIRIEHAGFKAKRLSDIPLHVNEAAVLDVNLEVGSASETVTVSGVPPLVETTTAQTSSVVTQSRLSELPLNGRDLFQLTELQTGVIPSTNGRIEPLE